MTHPLTPREKVARIVDPAAFLFTTDELMKGDTSQYDALRKADAILTALASGSGDHAELARLAEAATKGPWVCKEGSTSYPECDDKDFWSVVLSPAGKEIVTLHERYASKSDDRGDYDFDAAFIAAANPATVLALIAEVAALRASASVIEPELGDLQATNADLSARLTEAERKLAEATAYIADLESAIDILKLDTNKC